MAANQAAQLPRRIIKVGGACGFARGSLLAHAPPAMPMIFHPLPLFGVRRKHRGCLANPVSQESADLAAWA